MTYEEKVEFLNEHVRMPGTSIEGEDLMRLLSLTCYLTMDYRAKEAKSAKAKGALPRTITPLHILANACGKPSMETEKDIHDRIALHCDLLISHDAKFDNYKAENTKDMMTEIKRTIDGWLPF